MDNNNCICQRKPVFVDVCGKRCYSLCKSTEDIVDGMWAHLCAGVDENGNLIMVAMGDDESDFYYPKFCPECGRQLNAERK